MKSQYANSQSSSTKPNEPPQANFASLIGVGKLCILYPNIEHDDKEVGYALVRATSFTKECLYFKDIDPTSNDEILYKNWDGIGLLIPFNDSNRYFKRKDPFAIIRPGMDVLALWSNPDGSYTSVYYPAELGYNNTSDKVVVRYENGLCQSLHLQVEVCGFCVPTVIRKVCAYGSLPLKEALKRQKSQDKKDREVHKRRKEHEEWKRSVPSPTSSTPKQQDRNNPQKFESLPQGTSLSTSHFGPSSSRTTSLFGGQYSGNTRPGSTSVNAKPPKSQKRNYGQSENINRSSQRPNSQTQRPPKRTPSEDLRGSLGPRVDTIVPRNPSFPPSDFFTNPHWASDVPKPIISQAPKAQIGRHPGRSERKVVVPFSLWGDYEVPYLKAPVKEAPLLEWAKERRAASKKEKDAQNTTTAAGGGGEEILRIHQNDAQTSTDGYVSYLGDYRRWLEADTTTMMGKKVKVAPYVLDW